MTKLKTRTLIERFASNNFYINISQNHDIYAKSQKKILPPRKTPQSYFQVLHWYFRAVLIKTSLHTDAKCINCLVKVSKCWIVAQTARKIYQKKL